MGEVAGGASLPPGVVAGPLTAYCAYFIPLGRMMLQVALMIALFLAVTIRSPQLESPLYAAIVVVTLIALAWMVSHLVPVRWGMRTANAR